MSVTYAIRRPRAISTQRTTWGQQLRQNWRSSIYQLKLCGLLIIILVAVGVTFYRVVVQLNLCESLLQIVWTISTMGGMVDDTAMHKPLAQWFSIFFIITILVVVLWGVSLLIEATVRGEFVYYWGVRRMERRIAQIKNHFIICGFGRMGQEIARQFKQARCPFVVVEHNPAQIPVLEAVEYLYIQGDAREDEHLQRAGVERARGLVAVASTDEENVYITLSARVLNPKIYIVTRCSQASGEGKLLRAGADRVISPYVIGGRRMAQAVLQPSVVDFLDTVIHGEQMELVLEELTVRPRAPICGKTLSDGFDLEDELGVHVLGIMTSLGGMLMRDVDAHVLEEGDTLILLGEPSSMQTAITRLAGDTREHAAVRKSLV